MRSSLEGQLLGDHRTNIGAGNRSILVLFVQVGQRLKDALGAKGAPPVVVELDWKESVLHEDDRCALLTLRNPKRMSGISSPPDQAAPRASSAMSAIRAHALAWRSRSMMRTCEGVGPIRAACIPGTQNVVIAISLGAMGSLQAKA